MVDVLQVCVQDLLALGAVLHSRSEEIDREHRKYYDTAGQLLSSIPHAANKLMEERLSQYLSCSRVIVNNLTSQGYLLNSTVREYVAQDSA